MTSTARTLLRLALTRAQAGDASGAAALLAAVLALPDGEPARAEGARPEFVCLAVFGRMVGRSGRTIRAMRAAGRLPAVCFVGSGRGLRVDVPRALAYLRGDARTTDDADPAEAAGAEYVERRRALRVVGGGAAK